VIEAGRHHAGHARCNRYANRYRRGQ
jgi:hypothetical protein